jgi:hypothetical protein
LYAEAVAYVGLSGEPDERLWSHALEDDSTVVTTKARLQPQVIQAILRHSDISVTLDFYLATPEEEAREALDKVSSLI